MQEQSISTAITTTKPAIALPPNMPQDRMEAFLKTVAARLREATASEAVRSNPVELAKVRASVVTRIADEQRAIAQAITSEAFGKAIADAYATELANHQQSVLLEEAKRETDSIIRNRVEDCKNFVRLLAQKDFIAAVQAQSMHAEPPAAPYALSPTKIAEEIERLVQEKSPNGPTPAAHVGMTARGHQIGHQALANIFAPNSGALRAPLVHALATAWPKATGAELEQLAQTWLKARHDPAHSVADALKPDGVIYREAMRRAEELQNHKLAASKSADDAVVAKTQADAAIAKAAASSKAAIAQAPNSQTIAPREAQGKLAASPDLMMDAV